MYNLGKDPMLVRVSYWIHQGNCLQATMPTGKQYVKDQGSVLEVSRAQWSKFHGL